MTATPGDGAREEPFERQVICVVQPAGPIKAGDEIDLGQLIRSLIRRRWWIAAGTGLATLLAVAYALLATEWYRAEAVLMARDSRAGSGLSGQLAQFGGLADIAGLSLGQNGRQEPLGILRSKGFARRFVQQNDLVDVLASASPEADDPGRQSTPPDVRKVVDDFVRSVYSVSEDRKSGLVTVAVEWKDAATAADWANMITEQVNEEVRRRALDEAGRNISYLRDQLSKTESVSLQQAIARLLEAEMQKMMMAQGTDEYAFRVIDEAHPAARPVRPRRLMVVLLAFTVGMFISMLGAAVVDPIKAMVLPDRVE